MRIFYQDTFQTLTTQTKYCVYFLDHKKYSRKRKNKTILQLFFLHTIKLARKNIMHV